MPSKREVPAHSKNLSLSGHHNLGLKHSSSAHAPVSDQYRYKSMYSINWFNDFGLGMNEIDNGFKRAVENDNNDLLHALQANNSSLHIPQGQEKKIFDKIYKMKTLKFKPYLNECDTKIKKPFNELQAVKKPKSRRGSKNLDDLKNYINFSGQVTRRDNLNISSRRFDDSANTSQNKEKGMPELDKSLANKVVSLDLQNALLAKLKEIPSQPQTSQRSHLKLSEPPYPAKLTQKMHKKNSVSQLRRVGDLETLRLNLKHHVVTKDPRIGVQKSVQPVKGHRRGFSMDQAAISLNKSLAHAPNAQKANQHINPAKKMMQQPHPGNGPIPSHENNPHYQDPKFYEEFFGSTMLTFEFERNIISQLNKKKTDTNTSMLGSTIPTRNNGAVHSRTKSIEESNTGSLFKSNSRWSSQKMNSREDMLIAPGNSYLQETLNESQRIENIIEGDY